MTANETDAVRDRRLCSDLAEAIVFLVTVKPLMTDKPDADPVHDRVDQVIQDMTAGRVIPRKVDELSTAVDRAKRDQAVHRVTTKA
jgi:hypothetical protein